MKFVQVQMVALGAHYVPTIKLSLSTCTVSLEQLSLLWLSQIINSQRYLRKENKPLYSEQSETRVLIGTGFCDLSIASRNDE